MKLFSALVLFSFLGGFSTAAQAEPPTKPNKIKLSVLEFENRAGDSNCRYGDYDWTAWSNRLGSGLQDMLLTKIRRDGRYEVLERDAIAKVYDKEHELVNSRGAERRAKGNFKVADYALVGSVTEYEYCAQKSGGGLGLSIAGIGVDVGGKGARAKVIVDLRVIDTDTGEIVAVETGEGESRSSSFDVGVDFRGLARTGIDSQDNDPLMKAARQAIERAYEGLRKAIPEHSTSEAAGLAAN